MQWLKSHLIEDLIPAARIIGKPAAIMQNVSSGDLSKVENLNLGH
jgi:hypothetical protein